MLWNHDVLADEEMPDDLGFGIGLGCPHGLTPLSLRLLRNVLEPFARLYVEGHQTRPRIAPDPRRLPFPYDTNYDKLEPAELIAQPFEMLLDAILHDLRAMPHRAQVYVPSRGKGVSVTNFSKDQLDKIRALLEKSGVKPKCPVCQKGTMVLDRGQFGLQEVGQSRQNATDAPGVGTAGRVATCALFACNTCGHVRMHALAGLALDNML